MAHFLPAQCHTCIQLFTFVPHYTCYAPCTSRLGRGKPKKQPSSGNVLDQTSPLQQFQPASPPLPLQDSPAPSGRRARQAAQSTSPVWERHKAVAVAAAAAAAAANVATAPASEAVSNGGLEEVGNGVACYVLHRTRMYAHIHIHIQSRVHTLMHSYTRSRPRRLLVFGSDLPPLTPPPSFPPDIPIHSPSPAGAEGDRPIADGTCAIETHDIGTAQSQR